MALAGRFAAKEAFAKALDGAPGVAWHDVEVRKGPSGRPRLELRGAAAELVEKAHVSRWHVTISHDESFATAMVVLESDAP